MIKRIFEEIALFTLTSSLWLAFAIFYLLCMPFDILELRYKAYKEHRATSNMHNSISRYLHNAK